MHLRQQNKPSFCLCPLYKHMLCSTQNSYKNPTKFTARFLQETMELQVPQGTKWIWQVFACFKLRHE
ncbi:hypothetical protein HanXRQr2_Chr03g0112081 [Helianthus annuus]|uniref:Uncharacterized protein n=1 Tax=Helianthus annuus TaxID=4232 RepID=A0A251V789_HELAN|nr:hypothetical protein HanXRQr2_Chr03g0112081 [Helianthus annuus]KAJ0943757.1 hypothetical protein HanPSC8_Chr03g0108431 [Helianthus annuus]